MGIQFRNGEVDAGAVVRPRRRGGPPARPRPRVRHPRRPAAGSRSRRRSARSPTTPARRRRSRRASGPKPAEVARPGRGRHHHRHPGGQHGPAGRTRSGASSRSTTAASAGPATLKTGTSNEARDLNAYGYIAAPDDARAQGRRVRAGRRRVERQLGQLAGQHAAADRCSRSTSPTYVWQGFMEEATKGWSINGFKAPDGLEHASVDPWTGLASSSRQRGRRSCSCRAPRPPATCPRRRAAARRS